MKYLQLEDYSRTLKAGVWSKSKALWAPDLGFIVIQQAKLLTSFLCRFCCMDTFKVSQFLTLQSDLEKKIIAWILELLFEALSSFSVGSVPAGLTGALAGEHSPWAELHVSLRSLMVHPAQGKNLPCMPERSFDNKPFKRVYYENTALLIPWKQWIWINLKCGILISLKSPNKLKICRNHLYWNLLIGSVSSL